MISETALIDLIQDSLSQALESGTSVNDICAATGKGATTVRAELARLIAAGKAECVGTMRRPGIDGRMRPVPVYRPKG